MDCSGIGYRVQAGSPTIIPLLKKGDIGERDEGVES